MSKNRNSNSCRYKCTGGGVNSRGNHWCARDFGSAGFGYHYSNADGSFYYYNPNGSTYYNDGRGFSRYTSPSGVMRESRAFGSSK
ncbi:hypothetical protein V8E55_006469 [Tylopilus felleus]